MPFLENIPREWLPVLAIWALSWKGLALWHSAKNNDKLWYVAILLINTLGLLEIVYLAMRYNIPQLIWKKLTKLKPELN